MKTGIVLFRLTAIVVFIQFALGGLLTYDFISPAPHIVVGFLVFALAIATMVFTFISKPVFKPAPKSFHWSCGSHPHSDNSRICDAFKRKLIIAWIHLLNALAIYGMSIAYFSRNPVESDACDVSQAGLEFEFRLNQRRYVIPARDLFFKTTTRQIISAHVNVIRIG